MRDTIELAREAGFRVGPSRDGPDEVRGAGLNLRWFEALVRADEREACAKVCDDLAPPCGYNLTEISFWDVTSLECAAAIRARGNT
jgi:hypothetical protein